MQKVTSFREMLSVKYSCFLELLENNSVNNSLSNKRTEKNRNKFRKIGLESGYIKRIKVYNR